MCYYFSFFINVIKSKQTKEYNLGCDSIDTTSVATGVFQATVYTVSKEGKKLSTSGCERNLFSTPKRKLQAHKKKKNKNKWNSSQIVQ